MAQQLDAEMFEVSNGYSLSLFENATEASKYVCGLCKKVCRGAIEMGCPSHNDNCDHFSYFCQSCVQWYHSAYDNQCPINQHCDSHKYIQKSRVANRLIMSLRVLCPLHTRLQLKQDKNHRSGCEWSGELKDLEKHITECEQRPQLCQFHKYGCIEQISGANMKAHTQRNVARHLDMVMKYSQQNAEEIQSLIRSRTEQAHYIQTFETKNGQQIQSLLSTNQKQTVSIQSLTKKINDLEAKIKAKDSKENTPINNLNYTFQQCRLDCKNRAIRNNGIRFACEECIGLFSSHQCIARTGVAMRANSGRYQIKFNVKTGDMANTNAWIGLITSDQMLEWKWQDQYYLGWRCRGGTEDKFPLGLMWGAHRRNVFFRNCTFVGSKVKRDLSLPRLMADDIAGLILDTHKRTLSFELNGYPIGLINNIPFDDTKPLYFAAGNSANRSFSATIV